MTTDGQAAFLVTAIQGLRLVGKAAPDARRLQLSVEAIVTGSGLSPAAAATAGHRAAR